VGAQTGCGQEITFSAITLCCWRKLELEGAQWAFLLLPFTVTRAFPFPFLAMISCRPGEQKRIS